MNFSVTSLFSGAGGLDLGFHNAGFDIVWANEFDKTITPTLKRNFPNLDIDDRSLFEINSSDIPETIGVIGGPPCQSWSEAGAGRGLNDSRGQLFLEYIRVIRDKKPLFFLAENVSGILSSTHKESLEFIVDEFRKLDYFFTYKLLNASDYGVPQDRKRVFFIGYHRSLGREFQFPKPIYTRNSLKDAIWDLRNNAVPAMEKNKTNGKNLPIPNHEYMVGGFSTIYMSRNRVRDWDEVSFTIQAGGRHAPIHPHAPKMIKVAKDQQIFVEGKEHLYRRLSVRECARIQTFPDYYEFIYNTVADGYKMVGNAVPVLLGEILALQIRKDLMEHFQLPNIFKNTISTSKSIVDNPSLVGTP